MKHLMWILGLFAMVAVAFVAYSAPAVPKQFVGTYVGTYKRAEVSKIAIRVTAKGIMEFRIRNPKDGPNAVFTDTYAGKVAADGTFNFTNTTDDNIKFKGRFVANRIQGTTSDVGERGGVVNAKRRR